MTITISFAGCWDAITRHLPCSHFGHRWDRWGFYSKASRQYGAVVSEYGFIRVCLRARCEEAQYRYVSWEAPEYAREKKPWE